MYSGSAKLTQTAVLHEALYKNTIDGLTYVSQGPLTIPICILLTQAQTYYSSGSQEVEIIKEIDLACSILFALEWTFRLWMAHDRLRYFFSAQSMVDIFTCVPMFLSYIFGPVRKTSHGAAWS